MSLAAGYSWSELRLPRGEQLYVAQSDIKNYFYCLEMPTELRRLFSMPGIPSDLLRRWNVPSKFLTGGLTLQNGGRVHPCLRVVPMGWSWAMWIAQRIHQEQCMIASGLTADRLLTDRRPAPPLDGQRPVIMPYADNLNVAGTNKEVVQDTKDKVVQHLRGLGFAVHEELDASNIADSLGYRIDGIAGTVQPIPAKLAKVSIAFEWLSRRPKVSGRMVEKLIGHAVHFMLVRRELLAIFRSLYDFARHEPSSPCRLWRSAAREARWVSVLLKICSADLRMPWHDTVTCSDASLSGYAVCSRKATHEEVCLMGSQREGWRFRGYDPTSNPRSQTVERGDVFSDPRTVMPLEQGQAAIDPYQLNGDFREVEKSFMDPAEWHLDFAAHMSFPEHITLLESRGIVAALRHKLRASGCMYRRHLHLNDNLSAVLITDKGRSSAYEMLRVARRLAALLLASNSVLHSRWIPSEWNVADSGSRSWEAERKEQRRPKQQVNEALLYPNRAFASQHGKRPTGWNRSPQTVTEGVCPTSDLGTGETAAARPNKGGAAREASAESASASSSSSLSRPEPPGAASGLLSSEQGLRSAISGVSASLQSPSIEPERCDEIRRCLLQLSERHVRRRARRQRGQQELRRNHGREPALLGEEWHASVPPVPSRVDKIRPWPNPASSSLGTPRSGGHSLARAGPCPSRTGLGRDVHMLSTTRRGPQPSRRGLGPALWGPEDAQPQSSSSRPAGRVEGWSARRDTASRQQRGSRPGRYADQAPDRGPSQLPVSASSRGPSQPVAECSHVARAWASVCRALPDPAQRAFARSPLQPPGPGLREETRALGRRLLCEALRGSCQAQPGVSPATCSHPAGRPRRREAVPLGSPKVFLAAQSQTKAPWVIEIFAGSCQFSKAAQKQGYNALALDILFGRSCDILCEEVLSWVLHFIDSHDVRLVWLGMPCQSWSRARKYDGGPPPLRDDSRHIWGRPGLSPSDTGKVQLGNRLLLVSAQLLSHLSLLGIDWTLENPWTSRAWLTPPIQQLRALTHVQLLQVDYCQYHMPWRRSTGLLTSCSSLAAVCQKCSGLHGRCSATGKRHIVLQGHDPSGMWWTHRARAYPPRLCQALCSQL